jgi:hypothetical protein
MSMEEVEASINKYTVIDQAFADYFNESYAGRMEDNFNRDLKNYQEQMYGYITGQMKSYKQYGSDKDYCSRSYIDKVMEEHARSGSRMDPMEYYVQYVKNDKGIDVSVDKRNLLEKGWDNAVTLVSDVWDVTKGAFESIVNDPLKFVVNIVTAPIAAIGSIVDGGLNIGMSIVSVVMGDWEAAGKYLLSGVTDIASGVATLGLVAGVLMLPVNPIAALGLAKVVIGGASVELLGGVVQNVVGQWTGDYEYQMDGAVHVFGGFLKLLSGTKVHSKAKADTKISNSNTNNINKNLESQTPQNQKGNGSSEGNGGSKTSLDYKNNITKEGDKYYTDKSTIDEIGRIEAKGQDFSDLNKSLQQSRPSTEGGTSNVYKYSDNVGTKFVIHEVTDANGFIIHRDFDAVRIPSGQFINKR